MNRLMRDIVEVSFRVAAMNRERKAALAANTRPPPAPQLVVDFLRGMAGVTEPPSSGGILDDVTDDQHHTIIRAGVTLGWFSRAGCPIVSIDEPTAHGFATAAPPDEGEALEWPLGVVYGLCIGQGAVLVRHGMVPTRMPEPMKAHFSVKDGRVAMEAWTAGMDPFPGEYALANLTSNIGAALVKRPEGLKIAERHPSRQAARKQGLNPDHVPDVEFVIGSEITLGAARAAGDGDGAEAGESGRKLNVRTIRGPFWTHQVCGPGRSERRLEWRVSHWMGPEGAPISVHARRVMGSGQAPPKAKKKK